MLTDSSGVFGHWQCEVAQTVGSGTCCSTSGGLGEILLQVLLLRDIACCLRFIPLQWVLLTQHLSSEAVQLYVEPLFIVAALLAAALFVTG